MNDCALCGARVAVAADWSRCPKCEGMVFRQSDGPAVLVAHRSEQMSQQIGAVLLVEGFCPVRAKCGDEAIRLIERVRPGAAVVDVGLEEVPAFQVIEHVRSRSDLPRMGIVLIASVYDRTAYKRRPTSLYGADDYVEQHHIPDLLPRKLGELLGVEISGQAARGTLERRVEIQRAEAELPPGDLRSRAWALARRVVADIALYHHADVQNALAGRVTRGLDDALREGRRVVSEALGAEPPSDVVSEAWQDLLAAMTETNR